MRDDENRPQRGDAASSDLADAGSPSAARAADERSPHRRGGGGLATHLGVPVKVIRIIFVATSIPFGAGLAVYVPVGDDARGNRRPGAITERPGAGGSLSRRDS